MLQLTPIHIEIWRWRGKILTYKLAVLACLSLEFLCLKAFLALEIWPQYRMEKTHWSKYEIYWMSWMIPYATCPKVSFLSVNFSKSECHILIWVQDPPFLTVKIFMPNMGHIMLWCCLLISLSGPFCQNTKWNLNSKIVQFGTSDYHD